MFSPSLGPTTIRLLGVLGLAAAWLGTGGAMARAQTGSAPEVTVDVGVLDALGPAKPNSAIALHPPRHGEAAAPRHRERHAATRHGRRERRGATRQARAPKHAAARELAAPKPVQAETQREAPVAAPAPRTADAARIERAEAARLRQARAEIDAAARKASPRGSLGAIRAPGPGPATPPKPVATSQAPINAAPDLTAGISPRTAASAPPAGAAPSAPPARHTAAAAPRVDAASPPAPAAAAPAPVGAAARISPPRTKMAAAAPAPAIVQAPPHPPAAAAKPAAIETGGEAAAPHVEFDAGTADLSAAARTELDGLAKTLAADQNKRVQLVAYATGTADEANQARRLSLSRALTVRAYLIDHGVRNTRMDVRALGNRDDGGAPADRVDIMMLDGK